MARKRTPWLMAAIVCVSITGCSDDGGTPDGSSATTGSTAGDQPLYVALEWHMHQPRYPVVDDVITRPWVRAHATKDYLDMVTRAADSGVPVTVNVTPSLLLQLEELTTGVDDAYRQHTRVPAEQLTPEQRDFVLAHFFDTNEKIVSRFARYAELASKDHDAFTTDDLRDLQILWNLAWFDPTFLAEEPLASLVAKGHGFTEADKDVVFSEQDRIVGEIIPTYAQLWKDGKIEISTTPLAHPILPLITDTDLFRESDPQGIAPAERFREYGDAQLQVTRGLDVAERLLGQRPTGMWPGEGSVAQDVVKMFSDAGVGWIASGEDVLARSLDIGSFARDDQGVVQRADDLYRPYIVSAGADQSPVGIVFRDTVISDRIGFEYSGTPADLAAADLVDRLAGIRDALSDQPGPHLVTILLDGENAWEHYDNDGIDFLDAMYEQLGNTSWIVPTTPTQFLAEHSDAARPLAHLAAGSWIGGTLTTWIGEAEEADAWDALRTTRVDLRRAEQQGNVSAEQLATATDAMLWAEGSDWFWWYGADQESGDDAYFDTAYRELLGQVYDALGEERPAWLAVPIIPYRPVDASAEGTLDGPAGTVTIGFDAKHMTFDVTAAEGAGGPYEIYIGAPRSSSPRRGTTLDGRILGFYATSMVRIDPATDTACLVRNLPPVSVTGGQVDCAPLDGFALDLQALGGLQQGDRVFVRLATPDQFTPADAPGAVVAPDVGGVEPIGTFTDPTGDDHGPGSTTYPTDTVFSPGVFDLTGFTWGVAGEEVVFTFDMAAPVRNPWNSPNGLSVQTFDVYIDADPGAGTGEHELIAGRDAELSGDDGWDAAVTVEGWTSKVLRSTADGPVEEHPTMSITVIAEKGRVIARVPMSALGLTTDPSTWKLGVAVMSQDGYPSAGVDRVRDVQATASQWRLGGGAATRIIDLLVPDEGEQERLLGSNPPQIVLV
ncbi:MAG TPA: glucodextranase DOMON-like domain-containing protein [Ilumatobacteraceae bacterium]|nr:glucodextranase DOMON-like domain-containing protein [Ilumatobacteraceae bacterium]